MSFHINHHQRSTPRTMGAALVAYAAMATLLGACGGSSSSSASGGSYCDKVKALGNFEKRLDTMDSSDPKAALTTFSDLAGEMKGVADSAPSDIKAEWTAISKTFSDIADVMKPFADLDLSDPSKIDPKKLAELSSVGDKMKGMEDVMKTNGDKIQTYTKDKCNFDLGA